MRDYSARRAAADGGYRAPPPPRPAWERRPKRRCPVTAEIVRLGGSLRSVPGAVCVKAPRVVDEKSPLNSISK